MSQSSPRGGMSARSGAGEPRPDGGARGALPLGRWLGVPVRAHWSVLVILVLLADLLATRALPDAAPDRRAGWYWLAGAVTAVVFLVSVLAHELAHAAVARHYRMRVRRITLWMFGGMAELEGDPPGPGADALIALAGPLASLVVAGVSAGAAWWAGPGLLGSSLAWMAAVSVLLAVFNLLPAAPLDGGRLLRAALWRYHHDRERAEAGAAKAGQVLGVVLIGLGLFELLAGILSGLWLAMIGWFITMAAAGERAAAGTHRLRELPVAQVMAPEPVMLPDWWTIEQLLASLTLEQADRSAFVLTDLQGAVSGVLTLGDLTGVPAPRRAQTRLRELVHGRRGHPALIGPDSTVGDLLGELSWRGASAVVLDERGYPVGIVTGVELSRAARLAELGWFDHPVKPAGRGTPG